MTIVGTSTGHFIHEVRPTNILEDHLVHVQCIDIKKVGKSVTGLD